VTVRQIPLLLFSYLAPNYGNIFPDSKSTCNYTRIYPNTEVTSVKSDKVQASGYSRNTIETLTHRFYMRGPTVPLQVMWSLGEIATYSLLEKIRRIFGKRGKK
jgi:hypothetical protein